MDDEAIQIEVDALRKRLLDDLSTLGASAKHLKLSDTHGRAAAKKTELDRMARALGTRSDYTEGAAFDREKQEERKQQRAIERAERDRHREEEREKRDRDKEKWEAARKERDRLRRRQEDQARRAKEERGRMAPPPLPSGPRRRDASPLRSGSNISPPRRVPSPPPHRSPSPPSRRTRSPVGRRTRSLSSDRTRSPRGIRNPPFRGTRSPPLYRRGARSRSPRRRPSSPETSSHYTNRRQPHSPPPHMPIRKRRSLTPPSLTRRRLSRSPQRNRSSSPQRHLEKYPRYERVLDSPPPDCPDLHPPRRVLNSPPRASGGFGDAAMNDRSPDQIVDDRSPEDKSARYDTNGSRRSSSPKGRGRSASSSSSGSAMSVSGSDD